MNYDLNKECEGNFGGFSGVNWMEKELEVAQVELVGEVEEDCRRFLESSQE
jgi:hypothetical protein